MAQNNKIDSNVTGLRIAEEVCPKILPTDPAHQVWLPLEPNSYGDFGGQITTVARNPINSSRQNKKGVVTDLDASGGIVSDITQENMVRLFQGFLFAAAREKADTKGFSRERTFNQDGSENTAPTDIAITSVSATAFVAAAGLAIFPEGTLLLSSGFGDAPNNGLKVVDSGGSATSVPIVGGGMTVDASPSADARLRTVGFQFDTADLSVDVDAADFPRINSASNAFLNLGLIPGEWVFVGGDAAATQFDTAGMQGFARLRSVAADGSQIVLDKTQQSWGIVDDAGTGKTIQMFFGLVIKNESNPDLIKTQWYQLERTLGKPDTSTGGDQAEYLNGSLPSELTLNIPTADKATIDLNFIALDNETLNENDAGVTAIKSQVAGVSAPGIIESDAFNTSSDVKRIRIGTVSDSDSFPAAFFGFAQEATITINNNATPNKAIGVLGAFDVTIGQFEVGGSATAYFQTVDAIQSVRNNADVTLDMHLVKARAGISFDIPLLSLGDGRPNVEQDAPITLPLTTEAATGAKINSALDHTLLVMFWSYLPDLAL